MIYIGHIIATFVLIILLTQNRLHRKRIIELERKIEEIDEKVDISFQ